MLCSRQSRSMMAVMTQSEVLLLMVQIGIGRHGNAGVDDGRRLGRNRGTAAKCKCYHPHKQTSFIRDCFGSCYQLTIARQTSSYPGRRITSQDREDFPTKLSSFPSSSPREKRLREIWIYQPYVHHHCSAMENFYEPIGDRLDTRVRAIPLPAPHVLPRTG